MGARLADVFARSDARIASDGPLRITDDGIFLATPLEVVAEALEILRALDGRRLRLFDAGMGDGRIVASAALDAPAFEACGLESDASLFTTAVENLRELDARATTGAGSFLDLAAYDALGVEPRAFDVVMNYPDGNERALAAFFAEHGRRGATVAYLTPDLSLRCPPLALDSMRQLSRGFRLYLHRV